ncbi:MAG: ArsB/NhaD family transporter [Clostridia bacterium]|nr:ArsB/NhaD family transporter [Clostridia bacterium]
MGFNAIFALAVFVVVLAIIISEKIHRTVISLCGVCLILLVGVLSPEKALEHVDFNTIGLLIGMMIIVGIVKETGVFEYLAIYAAKKVKGDPWKILLSLCVITAITSAFLDNVTTVLLIVPMTFVITKTLDIDPIPFLIPEILASNIGGTATLIGDPPNIMIGSQVGLSFMDFVVNLGPISIVVFIVTFAVLKIIYKNKFDVSEDRKQKIMKLDEKVCIKDHSLLKKSLFVLGLVLLGFFTHSLIGYEPSLIALTGAALLLLLSGSRVEDALHSVEWPTIFFFAALFVLVGALREAGLIDLLAEEVIAITEGNLLVTGVVLIWFSAIVSAFVDNIPFVATIIPMVQAMGAAGMNVDSLWWAISLGACLGGNGTLIGASANVVVAGLAEKHGYPLSFGRFLKLGFPMMILSIILSTIYMVIFYFI